MPERKHSQRVTSSLNPIEDRKRDNGIPTFGEKADSVREALSAGFRNEKHKAQWKSTLETHAAPLRAKAATYCLSFGRAASSARCAIQASYSGVPRRGGTSLGIPPSHIGILSATAPLTDGLGSVAQAASIMHAMLASAGLVAINFMATPSRPDLAPSVA